jgi:transposase
MRECGHESLLPKTFNVSASTIKRYLRLCRQTGDVQPKLIPGPPARKRMILEEVLPAQVRLNPDLTLEEHCELFEDEHGVEVSTATMSRALKRLGLPLKKDLRGCLRSPHAVPFASLRTISRVIATYSAVHKG